MVVRLGKAFGTLLGEGYLPVISFLDGPNTQCGPWLMEGHVHRLQENISVSVRVNGREVFDPLLREEHRSFCESAPERKAGLGVMNISQAA